VLKPLSLLEIRLQTDALPTHRSADEARRLAERRLEHLRATAARAKNDNERRKAEDEAIAMAQTMPTVPVPPTLLVDDLTVEKLEIEIAQQDGALILASEEAGNLFAVAGGRYTRDGGSQLDTYLKCYDRGPIHTARISRAPVRCPTPELTILVTPQPVVLQQLRTRTEFHHRGLWPRCLFAVPTGKVGERAYDLDAHASELVHAAYTVLVNRLHAACARQPAGEPLPHLRLEGESLAIWAEYHDRVERALREGERLASLREWGSKHPGRVARLCGILHLATHDGVGSGFIAPATIRAAVTLGEYFEVHALLAYDLLATIPELANARAVVRWLQRKQLSTFSVRDAHHALQHRFPTVAMLLPCLELLVEYGYTRPLPLPIGKPGRPSPQFAVHPRIVPPAGGAA
jgi:hypothetical protein